MIPPSFDPFYVAKEMISEGLHHRRGVQNKKAHKLTQKKLDGIDVSIYDLNHRINLTSSTTQRSQERTNDKLDKVTQEARFAAASSSKSHLLTQANIEDLAGSFRQYHEASAASLASMDLRACGHHEANETSFEHLSSAVRYYHAENTVSQYITDAQLKNLSNQIRRSVMTQVALSASVVAAILYRERIVELLPMMASGGYRTFSHAGALASGASSGALTAAGIGARAVISAMSNAHEFSTSALTTLLGGASRAINTMSNIRAITINSDLAHTAFESAQSLPGLLIGLARNSPLATSFLAAGGAAAILRRLRVDSQLKADLKPKRLIIGFDSRTGERKTILLERGQSVQATIDMTRSREIGFDLQGHRIYQPNYAHRPAQNATMSEAQGSFIVGHTHDGQSIRSPRLGKSESLIPELKNFIGDFSDGDSDGEIYSPQRRSRGLEPALDGYKSDHDDESV